MQTKYGFLEGNVEIIGSDSTVDNESKNIFFRTKVMPNNTFLEDKAGNKVNNSDFKFKKCQMSGLWI